MTSYKVLIDDNFHYQDESERITYGLFNARAEAVAACRSIVDAFLAGAFKPGMSGSALYDLYVTFGDDPFILSVDGDSPRVEFSAWEYARQRSEEIARTSGA